MKRTRRVAPTPSRPAERARHSAATRDLVRRTGQMGVPVVEIDGPIAVVHPAAVAA
jgi:hypothetical protein